MVDSRPGTPFYTLPISEIKGKCVPFLSENISNEARGTFIPPKIPTVEGSFLKTWYINLCETNVRPLRSDLSLTE